ncbi:hypothetical protein BU24DRAFT_497039 [Aaosphaeria arxii CBS 175.79]|uniref:Zn(2)-C6 fungal-type domain-containing protein n=1 Tax=Aaosphaeria arxii CBS 175.79 TaxID=1450172 RepID=A0A6A5X8Y5_9PLEO|nr:uncharacterized protein BU24DRAFT_497039 [Aaosphaeria arxii CBS 175.79]KAF2009391.1 hypothetical protein BU24DRAFT_497039 [Aaosphaeria arxii CBS 175.79]
MTSTISVAAVCDTCRARKVKCDRDDPCGNCVDGNIECTRTSSSTSRSSLKRPRASEASAQKGLHRLSLETKMTASPPKTNSTPQSPSIVEAQDFISREISVGKQMPADRLAILNNAMSFVNQLSQAPRHEDVLPTRGTRVADILDDIRYPPIELLYWMLRELKGNKIGPHVLDYFKHVSPKSLKAMGLALINRVGDPETLLLYSICVNAAAFKFINTVLSDSEMGGVEDGMRACAARYLNSVKLGMARMHLLSTPSMLFLQALLCSSFIAQGSGDSVHCWAFISAACKTCEDINLESRVKACRTETEDDEELYYCYIWCHILDKGYSMMLGRSRCLLEHHGLDSVFASPMVRSVSSLLSTYLHFVPIQAIYILELHPDRISNNRGLLSRVEYVVLDLLERMKRVHARITELHGPSDSWSGLHMGSELTTIQFTYHCLRTSILRSKQICSPAQSYVDQECLEAARMAMSTLRSLQESSFALSDIRAHVSYMHWTVLYHPLTPFFVLFCNVVASSNEQDLATLKGVTEELGSLANLSTPIAKLQNLFKSFIDLCEGLVSNTKRRKRNEIEQHVQMSDQSQQLAPPALQLPVEVPDVFAQQSATPLSQVTSAPMDPMTSLSYTTDESLGMMDPGWGLFDVQPTLDWLDADFLFLDNPQQ